MTTRPGTLDQSLDVGGSDNINSSKNLAEEPLKLGEPVSGQSGSAASITTLDGTLATITGLSGITDDSVGRFITISGAASAVNNGTFFIREIVSASSLKYEYTSAVAPDANNGSISWVEREPYTLEDDLNFERTDRAQIKGTTYDADVPTYIRPDDTLTDVSANLSNIAGNTLDAKAWLESRYYEAAAVSIGNTYITVTDPGNLQHATSTDITGVPIIDGYDSGNFVGCFAEIVDAEIDGYGDGATLKVLSGIHAGERIFGITRAGASTSPNSVEIVFYSTSVADWSLSSISAYTWEAEQPNTINISYAYRQRLDLFDENAIRSTLLKGALSDTSGSGGSGGGGLTQAQHKALRDLIHFIDDGPADGFASGAYKEISGVPLSSSEIWYTSAAKTDKIVELIITRDSAKKPTTEEWKMYDADGSTVVATVSDAISYSGAFEISRTRTVS